MAKPPSEFIPQTLDELTPEWLTATLRAAGALEQASVRGVEREVLGAGEGFLGILARLSLDLDRDEPGAPRSLIAKLPLPANRAMGEMLGAYEREILFYQELASQVPMRTPRVYYGALDRDRGSENQERILAVLDRVPVALNRVMVRLGRWVAGRKKRRYCLLMEDLGFARSGDQVRGGSPEDCARILCAVARAHAAFWQSPLLADRFWLVRQDLDLRMRYGMFRSSRKAFAARFRALHEEGLGRSVDWMGEHGLELTRRLHGSAPETLNHCDLRLDNVFFDDGARDARLESADANPHGARDANGDDVVVFDWQLVRRGPAAYDVAYLLSGALSPEVDRATEERLLRDYHQALVAGGVKDYDFERLRVDYQRSLLAILGTLAATDQVEMGDDRGVTLMDLWIERLAGRLRNVDLNAVL
jgi:hypothetical protein